MRLIYGKSKWEMWDDPLEAFLMRVKQSGFGATEIYLGSLPESPQEIADRHAAFKLALVGQILTQGSTVEEHLKSLEEQFEFAAACRPALINSHAGRDIFPFEENIRIFERAIALSQASGIPFFVETHRGRPTYSAIETGKYLKALPDLRITADFSHWMVVHESDLTDQEETLSLAIERAGYIHARVGYPEGPQITDPRAPEWKGMVDRHIGIWQRILDCRKAEGAETLIVSPEYGPPLYMHTLPFTNQPIAEPWETNRVMRTILEERLVV